MAVHGLHGGQIDRDGKIHTQTTGDLKASVVTFLEFMSFIDATAIVRTGLSFFGIVVTIRGMACEKVLDKVLTPRFLAICTPRDRCL